MNHKLLITLSIISLSLTAFLGGYLISQKDFHRNRDLVSTGNILDKFSNSSLDSGSQTESSGTLKPLSPRSAMSPIISKEGDSVLYYEKNTGKVFEITLNDLREKSVSDISMDNLIKTVWAPSRKEAVSIFFYPKGNHHKYFSFKTKAFVDLGTGIQSLSFSPDSSRVAYFGNKEGSRGIFLSQPDGSSFKKLLPSRLEDAQVYWPSDNLLAFKVETGGKSELYSLSIAGEVKKILDQKEGLDIKWSRDGFWILFSQRTESGVSLFYKNTSSESETPLNIATSASKCDWGVGGGTIVCGVPSSSTSGDEFYEISLDGTKKLLFSPTTRINTAELFLSDLDNYAVILNSLDNKLYVLKK